VCVGVRGGVVGVRRVGGPNQILVMNTRRGEVVSVWRERKEAERGETPRGGAYICVIKLGGAGHEPIVEVLMKKTSASIHI